MHFEEEGTDGEKKLSRRLLLKRRRGINT